MKVGDLVRIQRNHCQSLDKDWVGMIVAQVGASDSVGGEYKVHWCHLHPSETSFEYGYYLEVISERR